MQSQFDGLFKRAIPYVQGFARKLVRTPMFAGETSHDIENSLWTKVIPGLRAYKPSRGSEAHWVVIVVGSARKSLLRHAGRRSRQRCISLDAPSTSRNGKRPIAIGEQVVDKREERRLRARMRIDAAMDGAPRHLVEVFHAMEGGSVRAAAKNAKLSRKKAGHAVDAIRLRLSG